MTGRQATGNMASRTSPLPKAVVRLVVPSGDAIATSYSSVSRAIKPTGYEDSKEGLKWKGGAMSDDERRRKEEERRRQEEERRRQEEERRRKEEERRRPEHDLPLPDEAWPGWDPEGGND